MRSVMMWSRSLARKVSQDAEGGEPVALIFLIVIGTIILAIALAVGVMLFFK